MSLLCRVSALTALLLLGVRLSADENLEARGVVFYDLRNSSRPPEKLFLRRLPCSCQNLICGCCAGMAIQAINFDRRACMNVTYDPYEFSLTANMFMDEDSIFEQSISGKNPPPLCMPVPIPYAPNIDFCVRFFNIFTPGTNLHMCVDFEARIQRAPVVVLHFDCIRMGSDGFTMLKPEDMGGLLPDPEDPSVYPADPDDEVYDEVEPGRNKFILP